MPAAWANVAAEPAFLALPPEEQEHARQQYFQTVVAPRVPAEHLDMARQQFDAHTQDPAIRDIEPVKAPDAGPTPAAPPTGLQVGPFNLPTSLSEVGDRLKAAVGDTVGMGVNMVNAGIGGLARPVAGLIGAASLPAGGAQAARNVEGFQHFAGNIIPTTESGEQQKAALAYGVGKVSNAAMRALPDNPAAQAFIPAAADTALSVGPLAGAGIMGRSARSTIESAALASERAAPTPVQRVVQSGFEIAPNDVAQRTGTPIGEVPGSKIQNATETPATVAARRQGNVTIATHKGAGDIKLSATDQITPEHLEQAGAAPGAVYDNTGAAVPKVKAVLPQTVQALEDVAGDERRDFQVAPAVKRDLARIVTGLKSGEYTGTQMIKDISGLRQVGKRTPLARDAADALETELENQLRGQPQTLAEFKGARETFAKIRDVEDSLKGGRLDPQAVLRLRDGPRNRPLSAGLAEVAHAADMAPNSVSMPGAVVGSNTPMSKVGLTMGLLKKAAGAITPDLSKPTGKFSQRSIAAAARAPTSTTGAAVPPIPRPGMNLQPPDGVVGREPPNQLGLALAPGRPAPPPFDLASPEGSVFEPMQRGQALPPGQGRLNLTKQLLDQIRRRNGELPGTLSHDE